MDAYTGLKRFFYIHIGTVVRISTFGASADLLTDPNVTCMLRSVIPNVTSGNPNVTSGNPNVTSGNPNVTSGNLKVTWVNPNVTPGIL